MQSRPKRKLEREKSDRKMFCSVWFWSTILVIAGISTFFIYKMNQQGSSTNKFLISHEPSFTKNGQLLFQRNKDTSSFTTIAIEIADNDEKREQGLMWHRSMPDSMGMLFIFENEKPLTFWMKNTYISLDILYINKSKEIVTIWNNTSPLNEKPLSSDRPAAYALEVNAGFCYSNNINTGDKIKFFRNK